MENTIKKGSKIYIKLNKVEHSLLKNSNIYYFDLK